MNKIYKQNKTKIYKQNKTKIYKQNKSKIIKKEKMPRSGFHTKYKKNAKELGKILTKKWKDQMVYHIKLRHKKHKTSVEWYMCVHCKIKQL